jgi:hypothetical protein
MRISISSLRGIFSHAQGGSYPGKGRSSVMAVTEPSK